MTRLVAGARVTPGAFGTAIYAAPGTSGKVDCGTDFIGVTAFTISAWFKVTLGAMISSAGRIVDNGKTILNFAPTSQSEGHFRFRSDGSSGPTSATYSLRTGEWTFVAVTRDASGTCNFYINNVLSGTANQSSGTPVAGSTHVFLGNSNSTGNQIVGAMDVVRMFNRVLTSTELGNLYNLNTKPADAATSCIAEYLFDEGSGSTANDTSGNGHTGTISLMSYTTDVPNAVRSAASGRSTAGARSGA